MGLAACFLVTGCALLIGNVFFWQKMLVFRKVKRSVERLGERNARIGHVAMSVMCIVVGVIDLAWPGTILKGKPRQRFANQAAVADSTNPTPTPTPSQSAPATTVAATPQPTSSGAPHDFRSQIAGAGEQRTSTPAPSLPNSLTSTTIPGPGPGQRPGGAPNPSALPPNRTALLPATATSVPATPPASAPSPSNPQPQPTAPAVTKTSPSPTAPSSAPVAKPAAVAETPESWPLPKPVLQDNGQILGDKALKAISLSLRKPEAGEPVTSDTPLEVGSVILAEKKGAGLRLAAVREVKETGALSISFLGDKAAPIEVTRADLKLPAESIRNLVIASGWSIPAAMPLSKGLLLETERPGNRFRTVAVLESLTDGKVKVHYMDWGAETVARSTLRFPTGVTVD